MKMLSSFVVFSVILALESSGRAAGSGSVPIYKVVVTQSSAQAINYRYLKSSTWIDFKGTALLANAAGSAKIKSAAGATEIKAEFENLPLASKFGPEYLTYVLWAISPEGRPTNLGELIVKHGRSSLRVTEQLQTFGLVVTAEPYFAVSQPSNVVILENAVRKDTQGKVETIDAKYELLERGQYEVNIAPSELGMVMDSKTPLAVYEARNAVRIAKASGADVYATEAFNKAQELLTQSEAKGIRNKERSSIARESVQRAEDARIVSLKRQTAEGLENERQDSKEQVGMAKNAAVSAALGQAQAESAQAKAELAQGKSDAKRAVAEAAVDANEKEKRGLRARLLTQFNSILETRDAARGLIVNMSGVLFATGKSDLRPIAREKLAKISGIVLAGC